MTTRQQQEQQHQKLGTVTYFFLSQACPCQAGPFSIACFLLAGQADGQRAQLVVRHGLKFAQRAVSQGAGQYWCGYGWPQGNRHPPVAAGAGAFRPGARYTRRGRGCRWRRCRRRARLRRVTRCSVPLITMRATRGMSTSIAGWRREVKHQSAADPGRQAMRK